MDRKDKVDQYILHLAGVVIGVKWIHAYSCYLSSGDFLTFNAIVFIGNLVHENLYKLHQLLPVFILYSILCMDIALGGTWIGVSNVLNNLWSFRSHSTFLMYLCIASVAHFLMIWNLLGLKWLLPYLLLTKRQTLINPLLSSTSRTTCHAPYSITGGPC